MARTMKFRKVEKGLNVFNHGEYGDKFYVIVKGVATVNAPFDISP